MSDDHYDEFFGPAIDRPPSPERIRQVNRQMKESYLHNQPHHRVTCSASAAFSSAQNGSSEWEPSLSGQSRRPLVLSADRPPIRVRDDSAVSFSRNLLHRRRSSRREISTASSNTNSLYSMDSADNGSPFAKESLMPNLFSRRKSSRDEASQRRYQISSPFNFKHVLHTDRESVSNSNVQCAKPSNLLAMKATGPNQAKTQSTEADASGSAANDDGVGSRQTPAPGRTTPIPVVDHLLRRIRSQEKVRIASPTPPSPPRPSRSPASSSAALAFPPIPPPRSSSRQAAYRNVDEQLASLSIIRPRTSGGFRHPQPYNPSTANDVPIPASSASGHPPWPLASLATVPYESPLPDVPEEEEQKDQSRGPLSGHRPSLKGSHSVPMLRLLSKAHRPMSGISETLGPHDTAATNAHDLEHPHERHGFPFGIAEENWEDDIDYCYEHEAEANCDYQWERTSLDTARGVNPLEGLLPVDEAEMPIGTAHSPGMDMPTFFPDDGPMAGAGRDIDTQGPQSSALGNFSLPRVGRMRIRASHASSFKESHGFTLSPSLLIPDELHHQLLLDKGFRDSLADEEDSMGTENAQSTHQSDESNSSLGSKLSQWLHQRSSTSTTDTSFTSRTESSGDRHHSANSSWSFLTRPTTSSTSISKMAVEAPEPGPASFTSGKTPYEGPIPDARSSHVEDVVPKLISCGSMPAKMTLHKSHASESVIRSDSAPSSHGLDSTATRRPRVRTASMSTQLPPVGQYSLFPRSHVRPTGDQI